MEDERQPWRAVYNHPPLETLSSSASDNEQIRVLFSRILGRCITPMPPEPISASRFQEAVFG